jgi:flagellar basal-body rod modification protein FlgD
MTEVSSTASSTGAAASQVSTTSLMGNYELFLSLLTTQIQNQDPLDPLDSAEYTNQLVQYSSVEQSIQTNAHLEDLVAAMNASQASSYVNYLGAEVTASGDTAALSNGEATWTYTASENVTGTVEIRNAGGAVVYEGDVTLSAGTASYAWYGVTNSNTDAPDGTYSISFDVKNADGDSSKVSTEVKGIVEGVDMSSGDVILKVGGADVPVGSVKTVSLSS